MTSYRNYEVSWMELKDQVFVCVFSELFKNICKEEMRIWEWYNKSWV